jgi:hypothetical protein
MFELISFVLGGAFRLVPTIVEYFTKRDERQHELALLEKQIEADRLRAQLEIQKLEKEADIRAAVAEFDAMVKASQAVEIRRTGVRFADVLLAMIEAFSATVRPVLTYWFCLVGYGAYKMASLYLLLDQNAPWYQAVTEVWTERDYQVMLSIIGFWFVDRSLSKLRR